MGEISVNAFASKFNSAKISDSTMASRGAQAAQQGGDFQKTFEETLRTREDRARAHPEPQKRPAKSHDDGTTAVTPLAVQVLPAQQNELPNVQEADTSVTAVDKEVTNSLPAQSAPELEDDNIAQIRDLLLKLAGTGNTLDIDALLEKLTQITMQPQDGVQQKLAADILALVEADPAMLELLMSTAAQTADPEAPVSEFEAILLSKLTADSLTGTAADAAVADSAAQQFKGEAVRAAVIAPEADAQGDKAVQTAQPQQAVQPAQDTNGAAMNGGDTAQYGEPAQTQTGTQQAPTQAQTVVEGEVEAQTPAQANAPAKAALEAQPEALPQAAVQPEQNIQAEQRTFTQVQETAQAESAVQTEQPRVKTAQQPVQTEAPANVIPFAPTAPAAPLAEVPATPQPTQTMAPQVLNDVVKSMQSAVLGGQRSVEIVLNPEFLGKLSIVLTTTQNGITAKINAGSDFVRDMLAQNIQELTGALKIQGVDMKHIDIQNGSPQQDLTSFARNDFARQSSQDANNARDAQRYQRISRLEGSMRSAAAGMSYAAMDTGRVSPRRAQDLTALSGTVEFMA